MSLAYNRFLISACLPVMAGIVCMPVQSVQAGFEWTPPEVVAEPVVPQAIPSENVESEPLDVMEEQPVIEDMMAPEESYAPVEEMKEERITIPDPSEAAFPIAEEEKEEITTIDETALESSSEPEPLFPEKDPNALTINPFPLETSSSIEDVEIPEERVQEAQSEKIETEEIFWNEVETFDVIEGFGIEMPLVIALRQVVPARYAFSLGNGVNPGALVSWDGGRPWNEVLNDMLSPLNVRAKIIGGNKLQLRVVEQEALPEEEEHSEKVEEKPENILPIEAAPEISSEEAKKVEAAEIKSEENKRPKAVSSLLEILREKEAAKAKDASEASVKRKTVLDPGPVETSQPEETVHPKPIEPKLIKMPSEEEASLGEGAQEELFASQPSGKVRVWEAKRGHPLKEILEEWSRIENVKLVWEASENYTLISNILISGKFDSALEVLFAKGLSNAPEFDLSTDGVYELRVN